MPQYYLSSDEMSNNVEDTGGRFSRAENIIIRIIIMGPFFIAE